MTKDVTENSPLMALYVLLITPPEGASTIYYSLDKNKRYCNGSGGTWRPDQVARSHLNIGFPAHFKTVFIQFPKRLTSISSQEDWNVQMLQ